MRIVALLKLFVNGAIQVAIQVAILRVISKDDDDSLHCHSMGNNTPKTSMTTGEYYGDRIGNSGGDPGGYSWVCLQGQCWGGS